jgi:hypothetical protein
LLGSYLKTWDVVWIDITVKTDNTIKWNLELFNHYKEKTLNNKLWRDYILSWFKFINFPVEKWKIIIETREDKITWVYRIIFYLELLEDVEFELEWNIIITTWEKIKFYELYYYDYNKLIEFMKIHRFKFIDKKLKKFRWQFLFEKE